MLTHKDTLNVLKEYRLKLSERYYYLQPNPEDGGHLQLRVTKDNLSDAPYKKVQSLLESGQDISFGSYQIDFYYALSDPNPNISIRWSLRWFESKEPWERQKVIDMVQSFAVAANASYVIFVDDIFVNYSDRMEDRFQITQEASTLDIRNMKIDDHQFYFQEIWIKGFAPIMLLDNRPLLNGEDIGAEFIAYKLI